MMRHKRMAAADNQSFARKQMIDHVLIARSMWYEHGIHDVLTIAGRLGRPVDWVRDVVFYRRHLSIQDSAGHWMYKAGD